MWRAILWLALVLLLPVPHALTEVGWAPVLRIAALGGWTTWVWLAEGGLVAGLIAAILSLQALAHAGWMYWLSGALLRRITPKQHRLIVGVIVVVLFFAAQFPIYRTPISTQAARANIWNVLQ